MKLLPLFYLPPISWWSEFLSDDEVTLEQCEHFPKQTYRNRTNIYGANGVLTLSIPIRHNGKRALREIEISKNERWEALHWKSIKIAYQTSPYFEFYEDQLKAIFEFEDSHLVPFNLNAISIIQSILKTEKSFVLSQTYENPITSEDFRLAFSAKKPSEYEMPAYYQIFSDKLGFIKDLSIIDLICNKGPESATYIKQVKHINSK
ncbi:WbqC family protein [Riemerella columbina]|uniref:WbqC family protein n=1 Tax=Riemerella columbina TaxID=103810 RepID=UPI00267052EC|nr:WbqC family protein [Riemerella columbina]WKS95792.1 WbqC family protein [Riemerella columbina]